MSDWTGGYVTDIGYTFGYYAELNPVRARLALLNAGFHVPPLENACELGFGQGVSINVHAAAGSEWWGNDFNPSQVGFARHLANGSGARLHLDDASFADYAARSDLPDFDFIGVHGIWSWVNDDSRAAIVEFVRKHLKIGGVLYLSYNTTPGWASFVPIRELLLEHGDVLSPPGMVSSTKLEKALQFTARLMASNPLFARANPQIADRLQKFAGQNPSYLVHEFMNRDWAPMSISRLQEWLVPAKLSFAGSAYYADYVEAVNLTEQQQALLAEIDIPVFREMTRDVVTNRQFRRDYWIKGPRRLSAIEQIEALSKERIVLAQPANKVELKMTGVLGEVILHEDVYRPILNALSSHHPISIGQLNEALATLDQNFSQNLQSIFLLITKGSVFPVQDEAAVKRGQKFTQKLNQHLCAHARFHGDIPYLASPVTGGAIGIGRFEQLSLAAHQQGITDPARIALNTLAILKAQGQAIVHDGKTIEGDSDSLIFLEQQATLFLSELLPLLKGLKII